MKELYGNGYVPSIAQAIEEMKAEQGESFSPERINLAELERRTGISRGKLRRLKQNGFRGIPKGSDSGKHKFTKLTGYTGIIDTLLKQGVSNSTVILNRLLESGFEGRLTIVKDYIAAHKHLIPAKRQQIAPQGNRGRRYTTAPGEAYQMDWGFTDVLDYNGQVYRAACFAMICHHCGQRYVEFFPNARQENLFIGMIHAFQYMGVPKYVLTDNMKSVVLHRDLEGHPVWQQDYEAFMRMVGFDTKLCKPRHPFTKGKVERLIRFVKENFLVDRVYMDELLRFIIAEGSQKIHFLGLGNILRCNIAHRASPRFTPVSQEIGPDDRIGSALDGVPDVVHVVGLPLFEVLEHICKRTGRFQERLALLIGQVVFLQCQHDVLPYRVLVAVVQDFIGRLGKQPLPILLLFCEHLLV